MEYPWLELAKKIQSIAQAGLTYSENPYDLERYEQLRKISLDVMARFTQTDMATLSELFAGETGYQTPKVDVRGVVFSGDKILMVREKIDGLWSLPGGWADVGHTPSQVAEKEVWEESGLRVRAGRLLAVLDKMCHPHPPSPYHVYKIFIHCEPIGELTLTPGMETSQVGFFGLDELPPLSIDRITESQIRLMFELRENGDRPARVD